MVRMLAVALATLICMGGTSQWPEQLMMAEFSSWNSRCYRCSKN